MKLPCGGGGRNRKGKILQASLATAAQIGIQIGVPVALLNGCNLRGCDLPPCSAGYSSDFQCQRL
jgi:hypothetical protein